MPGWAEILILLLFVGIPLALVGCAVGLLIFIARKINRPSSAQQDSRDFRAHDGR